MKKKQAVSITMLYCLYFLTWGLWVCYCMVSNIFIYCFIVSFWKKVIDVKIKDLKIQSLINRANIGVKTPKITWIFRSRFKVSVKPEIAIIFLPYLNAFPSDMEFKVRKIVGVACVFCFENGTLINYLQ